MAVKPNLALIPSGVKASKVYSVLPSDGVGDFDFSRSGNATRINKDGLIETVASNVPRLNYPLIDGVVSGCPSLLLEPQSTNLIAYSEDFSNASWVKRGLTTVTQNLVSPSGVNNAYTLNFGRFSVNDFYVLGITSVDTENYAVSFYLKNIDNLTENITVSNGQSVVAFGQWTIDLSLVSSTEWERITDNHPAVTVVNPFVSNGTTIGLQFYSTATDNTLINIGLWGGQVEQQSYPTSYIPTNGSQVTRSAETCNNAGNSNVFNDSEGVLMAEMAWINNDLDVNADLSLSDNSVSNRVLITQTTTKNQIEMFFRGTGATISQFFTLNDTSNFNKFAIKYKSTDFAFYINGFKLFESNSVATVSNLFDLSFDNPSGGGTRNFYGNTKQIQYFNTALTDAELEKLTSYDSFRDMAIAGQYKTY